MTNYLHRCLLVPASFAPTVRALCNGMGPGGSGSNMFLVGLSPTGNLPETHFISAGMQGDDFCALLPLTTFVSTQTAPGVAPQVTSSTTPGQPATIVYLAGKAGITVTLAQITAILSAVEITEEDWEVAIARRGLQVIRRTLP